MALAGRKLNSSEEITILCFGDSNTHGHRPDGDGRYDSSERWPRLLQRALGDSKYYVVEEGLGYRYTDLDHPNPSKSMKNGWTYFPPCVDSHKPNIVILMLGTNDAQIRHNRSSQDIAFALRKYIELCISKNIIPILVAPVRPDPFGLFDEAVIPRELWNLNERSVKVLSDLPGELEELSKEYDIPFFDANSCVAVGLDGLHWTNSGHSSFSKEIAKVIKNLA